jgi:hypothetical protein
MEVTMRNRGRNPQSLNWGGCQRDRIETVLLPSPYVRPYIEKVRSEEGGVLKDKMALLKTLELIMYDDLMSLYGLVSKKEKKYQDVFLANKQARELIVFAYSNDMEELALHVLYIMRKFNESAFVNFVLNSVDTDFVFADIIEKLSDLAVLFVSPKDQG